MGISCRIAITMEVTFIKVGEGHFDLKLEIKVDVGIEKTSKSNIVGVHQWLKHSQKIVVCHCHEIPIQDQKGRCAYPILILYFYFIVAMNYFYYITNISIFRINLSRIRTRIIIGI